MVEQLKSALRTLWTDTCTAYEYKPIKKENGATIHEEVEVISDEPCKLSFSKLEQTNQSDTGAIVSQTVKLFIDENLEIKPGSKILIRRKGKEFVYSSSGECGIFSNHQEIVLMSWKGWA